MNADRVALGRFEFGFRSLEALFGPGVLLAMRRVNHWLMIATHAKTIPKNTSSHFEMVSTRLSCSIL
jgi:hypothetical protein